MRKNAEKIDVNFHRTGTLKLKLWEHIHTLFGKVGLKAAKGLMWTYYNNV